MTLHQVYNPDPIVPKMAIGHENVVTFWDVLSGEVETGRKVAIIGGGQVGCEVAEFLAERGKSVVIIEMLGRIGADIGPSVRWLTLRRLREQRVEVLIRTKVIQIEKEVVVVEGEGESRKQLIEADTIVLAVGSQSNTELVDRLKKGAYEVYTIGDCVEPQRAMDAIESGFLAGCKV